MNNDMKNENEPQTPSPRSIRVLFICHGNICRSPMAEFIMKDLVRKAHRENEFEIASAATSSEEIWNGVGNPVYPPAKRKLAEYGISCEGKRARQITAADGEYYDLLIGMDNANIRNIKRVCGHEEKVHLLLEYAGESGEVSDPWYTDDFETARRDILRGCEGLLRTLK